MTLSRCWRCWSSARVSSARRCRARGSGPRGGRPRRPGRPARDRRRPGRPGSAVGLAPTGQTRASFKTGAPVAPASHSAAAKRSLTGVFPPKSPDNASCSLESTFTQTTAFCITVSKTDAVRFRQIKSVAGLSVTLQTAVAAKPARPAGPSVVMMFTAAAIFAMPSRNASRLIGAMASSGALKLGMLFMGVILSGSRGNLLFWFITPPPTGCECPVQRQAAPGPVRGDAPRSLQDPRATVAQ